MKVILHYIKPFIPRMSVGISIKFIGAVMELLLPWILSYLIDDIVPLRDIGLILLWGGAMVLAAVGALVANNGGHPLGRLGGPAHHPGPAPRPL